MLCSGIRARIHVSLPVQPMFIMWHSLYIDAILGLGGLYGHCQS